MATINYYLRGEKIYFRYRPNKKKDYALSTSFTISPEKWDSENQQGKIIVGAKTSESKNLNTENTALNKKLATFRSEVLGIMSDNSEKEAPEIWEKVKVFVSEKYFAHRKTTEQTTKGKPEKMFALIDYYINFRSVADSTQGTKALAENTIKKYKTLQGVLSTFNKNLKVTEINDTFRNNFIKYLNSKNYSVNTQVKFIKDIKMLCKFADSDHNVSKQVLNWKIDTNPENIAEYVTFTFADLKALKEAELTESLDNVRDWLLISCYTSVRVSELFTFEKSNIENDNGNLYLKVYEKKNRNTKSEGLKYVYLMPEVVEILNKRGGEFPRTISDQRYNEYLKKVCRLAGLTHEVEGGKIEVKNGVKRKVKVKTEFCELVTSHSGRATYVTLFSQLLPIDVVQLQTNHHSKEMVEHYNKTDVELLALQRAKIVMEAHREASKKYNTILKAV